MSYDPPNHDLLSEMLSAYLDGELTAEEHGLVEQRLAESAEFRQLHDELRGVRGSLDMLPRYKLQVDLAPTILRRAERAMLSAPAAQTTQAPHEGTVSLAGRTAPVGRTLRILRMLRWPIVAAAVAVLIMIFNPDRNRQEVGLALNKMPKEEAPPAAPVADGELAAGKKAAAEDGRYLEGEPGLATATNDVMVVQCEISDAANRSGAFKQLLAEQQIAFVDNAQAVAGENAQDLKSGTASEPAVARLGKAAARTAQDALAPLRENAGLAGPAQKEGLEEELRRRDISLDFGEAGNVSAQIDEAYFVEASAAQVQGAILALKSNRDLFPTVAVNESVNLDAAVVLPREEAKNEIGGQHPLEADQAADKAKAPEPGVPVADKLDAVATPSNQPADEIDGFRLQLQAAGSGEVGPGGGGSASAESANQSRQVYVLRGNPGTAPSGGSAQRVLIDRRQIGQEASLRQLTKGAEQPSDRDGFRQGGRNQEADEQSNRRKDASQQSLAPATTPPAAPTPPVAAPADGVPASASQSLKEQNTATGQQAPPVRVLFLFRVVPPEEPSR